LADFAGMNTVPVRHAWGDESIRTLGVARPIYLLGAVLAEPDGCDEIREQLKAVPHAVPKLHWRDADDHHRGAIHRAVTPIPVEHLIVVASPADPRRPERARAKCLERMLYELDREHVSRLIMETRTASLNLRDLALIDQLRGSRRIPATVRLDFELPSVAPMLWLPDQVLGMIGDAETGDQRWITHDLAGRITRIDIALA
jgi:hypothetical protein